jgi:hypothetical protein
MRARDTGIRAILQGCPQLQSSHEGRIELVKRCNLTTIDMEDWDDLDPVLTVDICKARLSLYAITQRSPFLWRDRW